MEEVYNTLSQAQKHVILRNGSFEFDVKQSSCCLGCGHSNSEHLDYTDCCLSKELCLCDRFLGSEVPIKQDGKLPRKKIVEDVQLNSYIEQLAKM